MRLLHAACALWFALMAGFFFAYSATVLPGLDAASATTGMSAMQQINGAVSNPFFAAGFWGALAFAVAGVVVAALRRFTGSKLLLLGCVLYICGGFLITAAGNVPMNRALGSLTATDPQAQMYWVNYLIEWTRLNTLRMIASFVAAIIVLLPLVLPKPNQNSGI